MEGERMDKQQIIVDRIENGLAVCETGCGIVNIPLDKISGEIKEGDILFENDNESGYTVAQDETGRRSAAMQDRFERLKAKKGT